MPDNDSFVDRMADGGDPLADVRPATQDPAAAPADDGEGKGDGGGTPPPAAAPNPDVAELRADLDKFRDELVQSRMEASYLRGQVNREQRQASPADAPKPFEFNKEQFAASLEKDPASAIADLVRDMSQSGINVARAEIERGVDGKLTQTERQAQLRQSLEREGQEVARDFADFIGQRDGKPINEAFDRECYDYAQDLAARQGNPIINQGALAGSRALSPGMMRAAADAVYGKWARANKLPAKTEAPTNNGQRSLRQIIDQVPASDHLGTNGARNGSKSNSGIPKTIEQLAATGFWDSITPNRDKAAKAAYNIAKLQGVSPERYVVNIVEADRNGEFDA